MVPYNRRGNFSTKPPFSPANLTITYILYYLMQNHVRKGTRCNSEKDHVIMGCEVMGIFVPRHSQKHRKG